MAAGGATCDECGFDWSMPLAEAVMIAGGAPWEVADALRAVSDPSASTPSRWSAGIDAWHPWWTCCASEPNGCRLCGSTLPRVPCWDEQALAAARRYDRLSAAVGLETLRLAAREWTEMAATVHPDAEVEHPCFGRLGAVEIARRNAHEVRHHTLDIRRWSSS